MQEHSILQTFEVLRMVAESKPIGFEHNKKSEYEFTVKNKRMILRKNGIYFGWYIMMLFDFVAASIFVKSEDHVRAVTKKMDVKFIKPATTAKCKVVATVESIEGNHWNIKIEMIDEVGDIVSTAECIYVDMTKSK